MILLASDPPTASQGGDFSLPAPKAPAPSAEESLPARALISFGALNPQNCNAAVAVGVKAFSHQREWHNLAFEYGKFAGGERKYLDPLEQKPVTLLDYRVAIREGKVVAVGGIYRYDQDPPHEAMVGWFAVDPALQRRGIGEALLRELCAAAKATGFTTLGVYTEDGSEGYAKARAFYPKYGFVATNATYEVNYANTTSDTTVVTWRRYEKIL